MLKASRDFMVAYKLVWFRAFCYFFIPAATLFLTQTETYSEETWNAMGAFLKSRLILSCVVCGAMSICAYIDSSLQKARNESEALKQKRESETQFLVKQTENK